MSNPVMEEEATRNDFDNALNDFTNDIKSGSKISALERRPHLNTICQFAENNGLGTQDLRSLLDLAISPSTLNQNNRASIIKSLYPVAKVPTDVAYKVAGSLGHGVQKPAASVQVALLRWLIMVYPAFEESKSLSSLYSVFFNMLGRMDIRAALCQVIAMITRKKHVKPFRLDILRKLSLNVPPEPALEKLTQIYDQLGSDHSDTAGTKGFSVAFPHPDPTWGERLETLQQQMGGTAVLPGTFTQPYVFSLMPKELQSASNASSGNPKKTSLDALGTTNVDDIAQHLEHLDIPKLKTQDLTNRLLNQYLVTRSEEEVEGQLDGVLRAIFDKELEGMTKGNEAKRSNLESILIHTRFTTTLPKSATTFLLAYLTRWDGQTNQPIILDLLSYLPIMAFEDLRASYLNRLETALLSTSPAGSTALLKVYTTLIHQWTIALASHPPPYPPSHSTAIQDLIAHTTTLLTTILTSTPDPTTLPTIHAYLNALHPLVQPPLSLPLPPPPSLTLYTSLFTSPTLQTLHAISSLLATFKTAFEPPPNPSPSTSPTAHARPTPHSIHTLNATLIDTCNLIFRSRAFNTTDAHALGCLLPASTRATLESHVAKLDLPGVGLGGLFGLSCHPALAAVSMVALRNVEDERGGRERGAKRRQHHAGGPVTQRSLAALARDGGVKISWKEYRVLVLTWLEGMGVGGVGDLGRATMRGLGMGGSAGGGSRTTEGGRDSMMEGVVAT